MEKLRENALKRFIPLVREKTGKALQAECNKAKPQNILEIGTAIGYSAILMANACSGEICTLEKDESRLEEAIQNFKKFGIYERVESHLGDAKDFLEEFARNGRKFDFIFLDGPKGQYIHYYPMLKKLISDNGVLFADNVKLLGLVEHAENVTHKNRTMTRNMAEFIKTISEDNDFEVKFYYEEDGYCIAKKVRKE